MDNENEILEELKKIREALEKAPPPAPPKGLWNEFKDFLSSYKVLGLAVAFVLGLYLGALVQAVVKDFIIPLLGLAIPRHGKLSYLHSCSYETIVWHRRLLSSSNYLHLCGTYRVPHSEGSKKMENRLNLPPLLFLRFFKQTSNLNIICFKQGLNYSPLVELSIQ